LSWQSRRAGRHNDTMHNRIFSHLFGDVAHDFGQPVMLWQVGLLLGTLALAWGLAWLLRRTLDLRRQTRYQALRFGAESLNRAFFPLIGAGLVWIAQAVAGPFMHTALLDLALVPLFGIGLIYIVFFFARRVFSQDGANHPWLFLVEKIVSLVVWVGMILTVMGIQDDVIAWMGSVRFRVANAHMTLLSLTTGLLWVCVTMIVAMWLGATFEDRLMRSKTLDANLKVVVARVGRAAFVLAVILISLSLVGIDITVLGGVWRRAGCGAWVRAAEDRQQLRLGIHHSDRPLAAHRRHDQRQRPTGHGHADPHALYGRARARRHRNVDSERKADYGRGAEPVLLFDARLRQGSRAGGLYLRRRAGDDVARPSGAGRCARIAGTGAYALPGGLRC
jgi:flagellar biogenesis protein FliO